VDPPLRQCLDPDPSKAMLSIARDKLEQWPAWIQERVVFHQASIETFELQEEVDVVVVGYNTLHLVPGLSARWRGLQRIAASLKPGGRVLLDCRAMRTASRPYHYVGEFAVSSDDAIRVVQFEEDIWHEHSASYECIIVYEVLRDDVPAGQYSRHLTMYYFPWAELDFLLSNAGFEVVARFAAYDQPMPRGTYFGSYQVVAAKK
jgi:SAM-dependent methyltransferase